MPTKPHFTTLVTNSKIRDFHEFVIWLKPEHHVRSRHFTVMFTSRAVVLANTRKVSKSMVFANQSTVWVLSQKMPNELRVDATSSRRQKRGYCPTNWRASKTKQSLDGRVARAQRGPLGCHVEAGLASRLNNYLLNTPLCAQNVNDHKRLIDCRNVLKLYSPFKKTT